MTDEHGLDEPANRMEAELATRKAGRAAAREADALADRLAEVDLHQREARFLLGRAGLLTRGNRE
jgi:hypothetical protein